MAESSLIEWTDATWNPVTGCSVVSPGCTNCYAMKLAGTRLQHHPSRAGLTTPSKAGPVWNGQVRFNEGWLTQPLTWKRPRRIFVCAHGDLFHEAVPDAWIDQVFAVMALAPHHTFQVLTKRAARMRTYMERLTRGWVLRLSHAINEAGLGAWADAPGRPMPCWPLPNVWLGVSAEDQTRADERIPELLATPAAVRFLSAEPLLGPIDLQFINFGQHDNAPEDRVWDNALTGEVWSGVIAADGALHGKERGGQAAERGLDWVIAGGESGPGARPMHPDWARRLRDDCAAAGVPFFFKQWGEWTVCQGEARRAFPHALGDRLCQSTAWPDGALGNGHWRENGGYGLPLLKSGKKAAGRQLDGSEHSDFPGPAHG